MGLLAFSALTIDLGSLWVARAQAQNAADAGALAGGVALAYVDPTDVDAAQAAATTIVEQHQIWGEAVAPASLAMVAGACPAGSPAVSGTCLQVRVSRGTASGTPLPVFFSRLFGVNATDVTASASAKVMLGNSTTCARPMAMPDRWIDTYDETTPRDSVWLDDDLYARYDSRGVPNIPPASADSYVAPTPSAPGSGITVSEFRGLRVTRTLTNATAGLPLGAADLMALDLPRPGEHPDVLVRYEENLESCSGVPLSIGATVPTIWPAGEQTTTPLSALLNADPGATWDDGSMSIRGSAFPVSPRLIAVGLFDPEAFSHQNRTSGTADVVIRNIVGFFLEEAWESGGRVRVRGVLTLMPGALDRSVPAIADEVAFLKTVALVR
jgi:hypothetical protein